MPDRSSIRLIVAVALNGIIGREGRLPWHLPTDLEHYRRETRGGILVLGRRSFLDAGGEVRTDAETVVLSRDPAFHPPGGVARAGSLEEALAWAQARAGGRTIWICGGTEIYRAAFARAGGLVRTLVHLRPEGDTRFPEGWERHFTRLERAAEATDGATRLTFEWWTRPPPQHAVD